MVRVNDRGPFVDGRVIDLSNEAAAELGFVAAGVTRVRVRYVGRASDPNGMAARTEVASVAKPAAAVSMVQLADAGPPKRQADYDYATAPKHPVPYSQLTQAQPAQAVTAASSVPAPTLSTAAPLATIPLPDVDSLLASGASASGIPAAVPVTYELQAGTFASEDEARRFASGLTSGGLPEVQAVHEGAATSYQVVVHGLAGPTEAASARSQAMALGAPRALIIGGS
jgi:rare lipoprotein A